MSYGMASALQTAVYQRLLADPALAAIVGDDIYDAIPSGAIPPLYVALGPEDVVAEGDGGSEGARHRFTVSVVSTGGGFLAAKNVGVAISDCLHQATPRLSRGHVVRMQFQKAQARREGSGNRRRIDLRFEAWIEDV